MTNNNNEDSTEEICQHWLPTIERHADSIIGVGRESLLAVARVYDQSGEVDVSHLQPKIRAGKSKQVAGPLATRAGVSQVTATKARSALRGAGFLACSRDGGPRTWTRTLPDLAIEPERQAEESIEPAKVEQQQPDQEERAVVEDRAASDWLGVVRRTSFAGATVERQAILAVAEVIDHEGEQVAAKRAALAARARVAVQAASQARAALMAAGLLKRSGPSSWVRTAPESPIEPIKAEQQPDQEERQPRPVEHVEPEESQQQAQPAKWHRQGWERLPSGKWLNPAEWTRLEDGTWQFLSEGSTLPPRRLLAEATPDQRAVYGDTNRSTPEEEGMSAEQFEHAIRSHRRLARYHRGRNETEIADQLSADEARLNFLYLRVHDGWVPRNGR